MNIRFKMMSRAIAKSYKTKPERLKVMADALNRAKAKQLLMPIEMYKKYCFDVPGWTKITFTIRDQMIEYAKQRVQNA